MSPPVPPRSLFEQTGRLCAAWAYLEYMIEEKIWHLLGIDETLGEYITYPLDGRGRWSLMMALLKEKDQDEHDRLKPLTQRMEIVTRDRNLIVHGLIGVSENGLTWTVYRGAYKAKPQPASQEFVEKTREEIGNLTALVRQEPLAKGWQIAWRDTLPR